MATGIEKSAIEPLSGFAGILRDQEVFGSGDDGVGNSINSWFDSLMVQSGMRIAPSMMLAMCLFLGATVGGVVFVLQENILSSTMIGLMGALAPIITAVVMRQRRQKQMMQQLPSMIDELARAAKTGRSIEQCWTLVASDTAAPLGEELISCQRRMTMGEDLHQALKDLPYRTGIVTLNILVTALSVHQQTGGDLVSVLERLSETVRDRLLFLGRLRAATVGSRWTAILMLSLPPFIVLFFSLRDPTYFQQVMDSDVGQKTTFAAIMLQLIGTAFVLRILKSSQRS